MKSSNLLGIQKVKPNIVEKSWGHEEIIVNDEENGYCGKLLFFNKVGAKCSMHFHVDKHEHFRAAANGRFLIECIDPVKAKDFSIELKDGESVKIPRGHAHRIICLDVGYLVEFSTFDKPNDSYRVSAGDSQK